MRHRTILVLTTVFAASLWAFAGVASADTGGAVYPVNGVCPTGKGGIQLTLVSGQCIDNTPLSAEQRTILSAKEKAVGAYNGVLTGTGTQKASTDADAELAKLTGEAPRPVTHGAMVPAPSAAAVRPGGGPQPDGANLEAYYYPFRQINGYYCGPATVQSMLWFLGPTTSVAYDTTSGAYDTINASTSHDQPIFANTYWLATDQNNGTNWGSQYLPFTLNGWRNIPWYYQAAVPNIGGTLTQSSALYDIQYDTDRNYPVAENVLYGSASFNPPGFAGTSYYHWDTVYGYFTSGGIQYVEIGQVYGDTTATYQQFYNEPWNTQWLAIQANHGLVW